MTSINNSSPLVEMSTLYSPVTEQKRMAETLANLSPRIILANARRLARAGYSRKPNWVLAMEVFGLGSTYARALCIREDIDPDAMGVSRS